MKPMSTHCNRIRQLWTNSSDQAGNASERGAGAVSSEAGFTLLELLVVIAIIGTLIGLGLPAVQTVRQTARRGSPDFVLQSVKLDVQSDWSLHIPMNAAYNGDPTLVLGFRLSNDTAPATESFQPCLLGGCVAGAEIKGTFNQEFVLNPALFQQDTPFNIDAVATFASGIDPDPGAELTWTGQPSLTYVLVDVPEPGTMTLLAVNLCLFAAVMFAEALSKLMRLLPVSRRRVRAACG